MNATRRRFIGQSACSALGSVSVLNTLLNLKLAGNAAAQAAPTDHRTLLCLFLHGGNDSYNWLVPRDSARHAVYAETRDHLALGTGVLRPLNQDGGDGQLYGIHPSCPGLQELFNGLGGDSAKRRAAFISNVGTLIQPVTKAQYLAESMPLPRALYSHSDQIDQWQTSVPQGMTQLAGWAGRAADVLNNVVNADSISMNISLAGNSLWQVGNSTTQFVVTDSGALTFTGSDIGDELHPMRLKNAAHRSMIEQNYANLMQQSYARLTKNSIELQEFFLQQFNSYDDSAISSLFPSGNWVAQQFRAAAKMIALRDSLGLHRQTLYLSFGGWDHHGELLETQAEMLTMMDAALTAFQRALDQLNLQDSVITYTASDFGRTLRSNGRGTDHAWGANALVMGGPVRGGRIYGTFPDLTLESNDDTGYGGRTIPTTSVDSLFAEMLRWFGVPAADMDYVLPNIANFYNVNSSSLPIGFLKNGTWS
ncbi:DUF1501 domain-containing protein [Prosthecobacter dejongeii]|uniref:Uncharacterized protein (DUF1501 family) n=1 Tax=Prosthecobacter dejongeii TaxID=48465 RepID=A0A7W7YHH1_9BACT|nr:DUF1501 domain-containing protein [Prosthecobacter dejongeii]MBB5036268.1 uncharacterized protein (DUF1501 family) [Prosthecobacter dejongeii]